MPIKVGVIGTGFIGQVHLERIKNIKDCEITALSDTDKERVKSASNKFGGKVYLDHMEMIKNEKLDCIFICVPPFVHTDQEILAAKNGIALFIEKPITLSLEKANEINRAIKKSGVLTSVGYCWRYLDVVERAKEELKGEEIIYALGYWMEKMPYDDSWWWHKEKSGGQVVEQTTHIFDLARYLIGEVKKVYGVAIRGKEYNVDDASTVILEFKNKVVANITSSCIVANNERFEVGLHIFTKNKVVEINGFYNLRIIENNKIEKINSSIDCWQREDEVFISAIKKKDKSLIKSPYDDAIKTLKLTLSADNSIKTGNQIELK